MRSEHVTEKQKPLNLYPVVSQIVDKSEVNEVLFYGETDFDDFTPSRPLEIQVFKESVIGGERPLASQLVVSIDYLHCRGMLSIQETLNELKRVTKSIGFFHVRTVHEVDELRQIDQPVSWWLAEFMKRFELQTFQRVPYGFYVIVYPRAH